ncbi:MAG: tRNA uridine(34) 5-carboxymethylaminomethyl modification radical SAM/GNAT enzyme Elp3 [Candidatus Parcubacteria bacterium]|nr:tRNA uridine(34) 5-carboxymethylaminomethyl modification radical SAM/GNAT enzyme Elp3 [Candidatus Parcubacteria bacterium]
MFSKLNTTIEQIIIKLTKARISDQKELNAAVKKLSCGFKIATPSRINLLKAYHNLLKKGKIKANLKLESLLKKREIRTLSGVAPIAVLTKPFPCPGKCVWCPSEKNMPKSYLSNEPAVMRAILNKFDPFKQVQMRLRALKMTGHDTDKCELIVMGGTWSYLPHKYQNWFIKRCFDAFNLITSKDLAQAQKRNETTKYRVIGLTLETRPDYIDVAEIKRMRELGATRVELGVQSIDDKILKLGHRGHLVAQTILATKLLKDAGFKISYHMMPNLPGATPAKDLEMFKKLFSNPEFQPDMLKIYPCVVTKNSKLYSWYKQGKFKAYTDKQLLNLLVQIKKNIPPYVRISRLIRDIPNVSIVAGNKISNLRQMIFNKAGKICQCIRCREARNQLVSEKLIKLKVIKYKASDGWEYFLSYESKDGKTLFALLRLRIPQKPDQNLIKELPELRNAAIIRELHTYGKLIPLGGHSKAVQHMGFGKRLLAQAEKIVHKHKISTITVISGIGVRKYYEKLGYKLQQTYLVKNI